MRLALVMAIVAVAGLALAAPAAAGWRPPVPGEVVRPFDPGRPFEGGRHRGVDLAAPPGTAVRAPCAGTVAFAGPVAAMRVVSLRCGPWRVTHLPLDSIGVRTGAAVEPGAMLGTVATAPGHHGLHFGVRREGTRFGYADPLRFLATRPAPPPLGPAPRPVRPPRAAPPAGPRAVRSPRPTGPRVVRSPRPTGPRVVRSPPAARVRPPFAPWPAWAGLALVLAGAGLRLRGRRARGRAPVVAAGTLTR